MIFTMKSDCFLQRNIKGYFILTNDIVWTSSRHQWCLSQLEWHCIEILSKKTIEWASESWGSFLLWNLVCVLIRKSGRRGWWIHHRMILDLLVWPRPCTEDTFSLSQTCPVIITFFQHHDSYTKIIAICTNTSPLRNAIFAKHVFAAKKNWGVHLLLADGTQVACRIYLHT